MERKIQAKELDIISKLPDHIIAHIISFLPTEEAIRTSILCWRWKYLWKGIHSICLRGCESSSNADRFANLVEHVLENCKSVSTLSIDLSCPDEVGLTCMNAWVSSALSCKLEKLHLHFRKYIPYLPAPPLPECILDCTTLVVLKFDSHFDIQIPESIVCFPCIKSLDFSVILSNQERVMHQLLSSCPILEELSLTGLLDFGNVRKIDICIPTLKKLRLFLEHNRAGEYDVTIDAPSLEYLDIQDDSLSRYVVKNLSQIRHVDIMYDSIAVEGINAEHKKSFLELLKGVAATNMMTLHFHTTTVLGSALSYKWPTFSNFTMLEVLITDELFGWPCIPRVLHCAPNLEVLVLDLERMNLDLDDCEPCVWTPPDKVPVCLLESLLIVGVKWLVAGNSDEVQAVEYLLKNARVLERMMIDSRRLYEEEMEKLLMCPKASGACDVQFYEKMFFDVPLSKISVWGI